jgi:predicted nuclease of restriction endonuclease-like RecB superfamily
LLPEKWVPAQVRNGRVLPSFLGPEDLEWLALLVAAARSAEGQPARELEARLAELPGAAPFWKARAAGWLLKRFWRAAAKSEIDPEQARVASFTAAAQLGERRLALASAAESLNSTPEAVEASLFADLPGERIVHPPAEIPTPGDLATRTNLLIARSLLFRAAEVEITVDGEVAPLVRLAKRKGLLCVTENARLRLSGPFALFHRTLLYGRALGDLLPSLPSFGRFELRAECRLRGLAGELRLDFTAPIFTFWAEAAPLTPTPRWEERLIAELPNLGWQVTVQTAPVPAGDTLLFPDLLLQHSDGRRVFVELVGFWTPEHVARLLARPLPELIVCVDEERRCADGELLPHPQLVRYRKKLTAAQLVAGR